MLKHPLLLLLVVFVVASCSDELPTLPYDKTETGLPGDAECIFRVSEDTLFACGGVSRDGWIIRSTDGGISWNLLSRGFYNSLNNIYFTNSTTGYIADSDVLIFKTTDGGITWNQFYPGFWPLNVNRNLRSICFANDTLGFVCGGKNLGNGLIYRTTNGGQTWDFTEFNHELRGISFLNSSHGFAVGYGVILETTDGGQHWAVSGGEGNYFMAVDEGSSGAWYRTTLDGKVEMATSIGSVWNQIRGASHGMASVEKARCIASAPSGAVAIGGHKGFVSYSSNQGSSWNSYQLFGGSDVNDLIIRSDGTIIAAGENGTMYRCTIP